MDHTVRDVMSGEARGGGAALLRGLMRLLEPVYTAVVASRNASYRSGILRAHRCARPVVSVGNITTGGTGKTPVVRWLADRLRQRGLHPAILMRGYRREPGAATSDEQQLLMELLDTPDAPCKVVVHAEPDRVGGAQHVLSEHADVDVFILDDGFQHRRLHRDFDLVLIDATNPFGFDHVLPRGLLREPLRGLARANAILITRVDQALPGELDEIEKTIRRCATSTPIYRASHLHTGVVSNDSSAPSPQLNGRRVLAFCGVGNPDAFGRQLEAAGAQVVTRRWFADHHHYDAQDLMDLEAEAKHAGAEAMVTTEKDWVKLSRLPGARQSREIPIWRVRLDVRFVDDDERKLLDQIINAIPRRPS